MVLYGGSDLMALKFGGRAPKRAKGKTRKLLRGIADLTFVLPTGRRSEEPRVAAGVGSAIRKLAWRLQARSK